MKLLSAFSLNMLDVTQPQQLNITLITTEDVREFHNSEDGPFESAVGHADTAAIFSNMLGLPVAFNRANVTLRCGEQAIVGQYIGPRLPEGATALPEGATIRWLLMTLK